MKETELFVEKETSTAAGSTTALLDFPFLTAMDNSFRHAHGVLAGLSSSLPDGLTYGFGAHLANLHNYISLVIHLLE